MGCAGPRSACRPSPSEGASPPLTSAAAPLKYWGLSEPGDAQAYASFVQQMLRFAAVLAPVLAQTPPRLGTERWADRLSLLHTAWRIRRLGRRAMRELLRIGGMNVYDLLQEHFQNPLLQGAIGLDAILGTNLGPRSPGTVMTLLYRLAAQFGARARGLALPAGGMGAVTEALAASARQAGAQIRTGAAVARVLVKDDRACGVRLVTGEEIAATQRDLKR